MNVLVVLIPVSLLLGGLGLVAFVWALRARQCDDPQGHAARILLDDKPQSTQPETITVDTLSGSVFSGHRR